MFTVWVVKQSRPSVMESKFWYIIQGTIPRGIELGARLMQNSERRQKNNFPK